MVRKKEITETTSSSLSGHNFLKQMIKETKNEYASVASEGTVYDTVSYIDLGNYLLNKQAGGDMFKGIAGNTCCCFAGEEGVGKTYLVLGIIHSFLENNPEGVVALFESEGAVKKSSLEERNIDTSRVSLYPIGTIEDFKFQCNKIIDSYGEIKKEERFPLLIALDSLGMLSNNKELADTVEGEEKADMGAHAKRIKATFRIIRQKLAKYNIPLFLTNHIFADPSSFTHNKVLAGGSGIKYASDSIFVLTKKKIKQGEEAFEDGGIAVTCTASKMRETRPFTQIPFVINFTKGVTRYSGLFDFCLDNGFIVKQGMQYSFIPEIDETGNKFFKKTALSNPESIFTEEIVKKINSATDPIFKFGESVERVNSESGSEVDEETETENEI